MHRLAPVSSDLQEIHSYTAISSPKPVREYANTHLSVVKKQLVNTDFLTAILSDNVDPCQQSPCGPYSQCKSNNGQAVCSCLSNYIGAPPGCKPECTISTECATNRACENNKCIDPCPNSCGQGTTCRVVNHSPICMCKSGFSGDPFTRCTFVPRKRPKLLYAL